MKLLGVNKQRKKEKEETQETIRWEKHLLTGLLQKVVKRETKGQMMINHHEFDVNHSN